jgi:tetratricopeptide (TPR) repeat protein
VKQRNSVDRTLPSSPAEDHSHYPSDHAQREHLAALIERFRGKNPFEKLGIKPNASEPAIHQAYARLAKETHPDRFALATDAVKTLADEAFREVSRAYGLLSDPHRLAAYRAEPDRDEKETQELAEGYRALEAEREFQKGETYLRARKWAEALRHFERAVELYPEEGEYHAYSGWAYYLTHGSDTETLKAAFARVKHGAKLAPDRERPYLFLGRLAQVADRLDLAERCLGKALECKPDSIEAQRELRLLEMRRPKRGFLARLSAKLLSHS